MADDLIAFLAARLDEEETAARTAADRDALNREDGGSHWTTETMMARTTWDWTVDDHIARHDPARVLREVEAKRKIIEVYEAAAASNDPATDYSIGMATLRMVLRSYASVWNDHPDCRPEWTPPRMP